MAEKFNAAFVSIAADVDMFTANRAVKAMHDSFRTTELFDKWIESATAEKLKEAAVEWVAYVSTPVPPDDEIKRLIAFSNSRIADANKVIKRLQTNCRHNGLVGEYKSNTGNFDPSCDCYWIELTCPVCERKWREDQDSLRRGPNGSFTSAGFLYTTK